MTSTGKLLLGLGGALSGLIAAMHLVVILVGAPAYRYFGAGETLARQAEAGSPAPARVTFAVALAFAVAAACGLAGAGALPRPPLLRPALVTIAAVYLLRGLSTFPQAIVFVMKPDDLPLRYFLFSLVSLIVGLCYAMGVRVAWDWLGPKSRTGET